MNVILIYYQKDNEKKLNLKESIQKDDDFKLINYLKEQLKKDFKSYEQGYYFAIENQDKKQVLIDSCYILQTDIKKKSVGQILSIEKGIL